MAVLCLGRAGTLQPRMVKPSTRLVVLCDHARHGSEKRTLKKALGRGAGMQVARSALLAASVALGTCSTTVVPPPAWASTIEATSNFPEELLARVMVGDVPPVLSASGDDELFGRSFQSAAPKKASQLSWNQLKRGLVNWRNSPRFSRDILQYAIIAVVLWRIRDARKPDSVAMRLGVWDKETEKALVGTRWKLILDVGREKGTWMPPAWASSGRRIEIPVAIEFQEGGVLKPLGVGTYVKLGVEAGTWQVEGDTLRFNLSVTGFERGDISLPEGFLYFKTYAWGNMVSQNKGRMLIRARRNFIRLERRTVGTFKCEMLEHDGVEYNYSAGEKMSLGPARVKEGDVMFPVDF